MSDDPTAETETKPSPTDRPNEPATGSEPAGASDDTTDTVLSYLHWGGLLALGVLAVVAGAGLYTSLSAIIDLWVADYYQPFARAGFNFAVLCVAVAGMVALLRRV